MKAAGRFGAQTPTPQHQSTNSSGLPPPTFNHAFSQGNNNPFAPTGNVNGLAGGFGSGGFGNGGTGLASREAVEGFNYGAQLQQQSQNKAHMRRAKGGSKGQQEMRIRDVWSSNLKEEMDLLEQLVERYSYISMDTEFPGIVARPMGRFTTKADYHYQCLRCNVDLLKVIQLGISLFDEEGNSPPANLAEIPGMSTYSNNLKTCPTTWQFNFQFSLEEDMYNDSSITFLQEAGIDLKRFEADGIDPEKFGSRLITSGLAHFEDVRWISFHSGYDFAYVVKLMNRNELPEDETEYRKLMNIYFPSIYDIKFMIQHAQRTQSANDQPLTPAAANHLNNLSQKGGLQHLADELHVRRVGNAHSAGSDALLTGKVFWEVKEKIFGGVVDDTKYLGQVWGLNVAGTAPGNNSIGPTVEGQSGTPNLNGATIYNNPPNQQNTPSTPASSHTGPAGTPSQQNQQSRDSSGNGGGIGSWTPGGGGGVFGAFRGANRS
ncbi:MAG: hypothetical protein Q9217_001427 [Psora testacea]